MQWNSLDLGWRSLISDQPLSAPRHPFQFATPGEWAYGAISDPLPDGQGLIVRVRFKAMSGIVSAFLSKPNGSLFLTQEVFAPAEGGEVEALFVLEDHYGPASLVLRNYGVAQSVGVLSEVTIGSRAALGPEDVGRLVPTAAPIDDSILPSFPASCLARADETMWPVSLGNTCEAKVQIARVLQFRRWPETSHAAFRLQMLPPDRSKDRFGWSLFDWQGTPFNSMFHYLDQDFEGVYERSDLVVDGRRVGHRTLRCDHSHDFEHLRPRGQAILDEAVLDEGYAAGRARFDQLAGEFRQHLLQPGPFLYVHVCEDIPSDFRVRQLIQRLSSRSPDHRFHLLLVGFEDEDSDLSRLSEQVSKAYRPRPPADANPLEWEGDYVAWDKALAPFKLLLPGEIQLPPGLER